MINKLERESAGQIEDTDIPKEEFISFYKKLNKADTAYSNKQQNITQEFETLKSNINFSVSGESNNEITCEEMIKAIKLLKNGKSASSDLISNEMLKNSTTALIKPLCKLFKFFHMVSSLNLGMKTI